MELNEFVSSTFSEIIKGVMKAREDGDDAEGIASNLRNKIDNLPSGLMQDARGALYSTVEFDVAVTATSKVEGKGGKSAVVQVRRTKPCHELNSLSPCALTSIEASAWSTHKSDNVVAFACS